MIPLYKPFMPEELPEMNAILHSGALAYGKWGREFEKSLEAYTGAPHVAVVNSFNAAVQIALLTLGIGYDDEVITSPQSCLASNMPILSVGAKAVWADIDPRTGTLSPDSVRKKLTAATKAIFHNHHCGYPGYINEIKTIVSRRLAHVTKDERWVRWIPMSLSSLSKPYVYPTRSMAEQYVSGILNYMKKHVN